MVVGIDLGTTNSSCALHDGREIVVVPNERGSRTTPSVVALAENGEILVGEAALNQALLNPDHAIRNAKRLLGPGKPVQWGGQPRRPEEILAHILRQLKHDAEAYLAETVREAVITVPAYFSESQRRSVREAGALAGLTVRRLLNEPTAAAVAWAWSVKRSFDANGAAERILLVYDLGGGTFDATILALRGGSCRVVAGVGDNALGGADFDQLLMREADAFFRAQVGPALADPLLRQQLFDLAVRAKIELSSRESALVRLPFFGMGDSPPPIWRIHRSRFNELIAPYVDRTTALVESLLAEAGLAPEMVDHLLFSGGSSRIPLVRERVQELLGKTAESRINPEEIVSYGAAVYAGLAEGSLTGLDVLDAISRSFGIENDGDLFVPLIAKNTPIPITQTMVFTTVADDQPTVEIHVLQGESPRASENLSLGRFILNGIRPGEKGQPRIELEFSIDGDEILEVRARDLDTGAEQGVTIAASAEAPGGVDAPRLRSLMEHARSLAAYAKGDIALEAELREAVDGASRGLADPETAAAAALTLGTLIAELRARRKWSVKER